MPLTPTITQNISTSNLSYDIVSDSVKTLRIFSNTLSQNADIKTGPTSYTSLRVSEVTISQISIGGTTTSLNEIMIGTNTYTVTLYFYNKVSGKDYFNPNDFFTEVFTGALFVGAGTYFESPGKFFESKYGTAPPYTVTFSSGSILFNSTTKIVTVFYPTITLFNGSVSTVYNFNALNVDIS